MDKLKSVFESALRPSGSVILLGTLVVLLAPVLLHYLLAWRTSYTTLPRVILMGPSGSGKTALLTLYERASRQADAAAAATHTSQTRSAVELAVAASGSDSKILSFRHDLDAAAATARRFLLVDTPGHAKLRGSALAHVSDSNSARPVRALVFLVDAAALVDGDTMPVAAEFLYDVLLALQRRHASRRLGHRRRAHVLVAANKLDLFTALPAALVRSGLEAELGRIRRARSRALLRSDVGDALHTDETDDWLGEYGSDTFTFAQMVDFDVEVLVLGGNVLGDGPGVEAWWRWIAARISSMQ